MLQFIDVSLSHTSDVMQNESKVSFFLSLIKWHLEEIPRMKLLVYKGNQGDLTNHSWNT